MDEEQVRALAVRASESLAAKRQARNKPRRGARLYIRAMLSCDPRLKLPELVQLEETKQLMEALEITRPMLGEELKSARADLKTAAATDAVRVPKQTRKRRNAKPDTPHISAQPSISNPAQARGMVANGSIADL
jgi:hypothetical protein